LWFQSPQSDHLEAMVVLWPGDAAKAEGLFPECTQIAPIQGARSVGHVDVTLQTAAERQQSVAASGCLARAGARSRP
jgi:hypothetical protein